ncbi:MAG: peptide chain release factor 1 [Sulfurospirillaceae bacterium]|nr:peptide chain release factor 1 [Sulfurospirillaceae bacterium]
MLKEKLLPFIKRYDELTALLSSPDIANDIKKMTALSKEQASIEDIKDKTQEYIATLKNIDENRLMLDDEELGELVKEDLKYLENKKETLEDEIKLLLLPTDPNDDRNIFLEIRAGTGGDEAAIFASDLFKSYLRYAENRGWKVEIVSISEGVLNGFKEVIALIKGQGAFSRLKYEGGVHRVQRVPLTESQGRVHTSAVTVAVMPEVEDVDIEIGANDLKIDVMRSSGNGGQSVNTTDSAVRITHLPTGIVVVNQDGKSQHKNKDAAMKILKAKLYDLELQERNAKESEARKAQVGSGDRSARIRTYNYPQNRITDHRIGLTLYRLDAIMEGGLYDEIIEPIIAHYQAELIKEAGL